MKQLVLLLCGIMSLLMLSCSSDDDNNNPLVGTEWYSDNIGSAIYSSMSGGSYQLIWKFTSNTTYEQYYQDKNTGKIGDSGHLTNQPYVYQDSCIVTYSNENKESKWYFLSSTKLSNHKDTSESWTVIFNKK